MNHTQKPREKLIAHGPKALSDDELLAALIGNGIKGHNVFTLSKSVLKVIDDRNGSLSLEDLSSIKGIGQAKAIKILSALEFARRRIHPEGLRISMPTNVLPLLVHYQDRKQEHFICISLNGANEVIATRVVSVGLVNQTQVHPREVFADPLMDRATSVIIAHNHPSGELTPSKEDIKTTEALTTAGKILGIKLLDHIIFTKSGYFSFQEKGLMN